MIRKLFGLFLVIVAVLAVPIALSYHRDMRLARARASTRSKIADTACGPIEYADVGSGPVILAIHGAGGGFDQSLTLAQAFVEPGYRVIAPSRFGYLRTAMPADGSPVAQADAHACLLDALDVRKAVVIGGSMGAPSAMQLCLRHPDHCSALVLLFPIAFAPRPSSRPQTHVSPTVAYLAEKMLLSDFAYWAMCKVARDKVFTTIMATPPDDFRRAPPEEQITALEIMEGVEPVSLRRKGLKSDANVAISIPRFDVEHIAVPTLVIAAKDDLYGTYDGGSYTAEHIPRARFIGFPDGGHLLLGHRKEVRTHLTDFLHANSADQAK